MTKKDIVRLVSEKTDLSQQMVKEIVQQTFESIIEVLAKDGRIELRNFGVFKVKVRAARNARNPRTSQEVWVPEHETVAFKPGKLMVSQVQRERQKKSSKKKAAKTAKVVKTTGAKTVASKKTTKPAKSTKRAR